MDVYHGRASYHLRDEVGSFKLCSAIACSVSRWERGIVRLQELYILFCLVGEQSVLHCASDILPCAIKCLCTFPLGLAICTRKSSYYRTTFVAMTS